MIAILDFGSQYTQLIARSVRRLGVYSTILPASTTPEELLKSGAAGIILSGGPASVLDANSPRCDPQLLDGRLPVLGICYGMQLMAHLLGGAVRSGRAGEYGQASIDIDRTDSPLFRGLTSTQTVWMSHGDEVTSPPEGFAAVAHSADGAANCIVAIQDHELRRFGVQFHPEVLHTPQGQEILSNFLFGVCGCDKSWTPARFVEESTAEIRSTVGAERVILGVSGGVDSSVAAVLMHRAIGDLLIPVFIDNGLLRFNEREEVIVRFRERMGIEVRVYDASEQFLTVLAGVSDPETKRKLIGKAFVDAFAAALRLYGTGATFLGQGTLYPDVIESRAPNGGPSVTIKTHHNVGGLPPDLNFTLLEPLKWLFKDDVRRIGRELGLDDEIINRHPFPGPGLAVRCLGEITRERLETLRAADAIFIDELRRGGQYDHVAQALAVLLPVKSVGVMGDARTYEEVVALRAVTTQDFMTADWAFLPPELLGRVSNRIINEVRGVNRVVYDISSKPPATIEWE